jgi:hypothetical protein
MSPDQELPGWMLSLLDQRMAMIEHAIKAGAAKDGVVVIATPLNEPPEGSPPEAYARDERTCDNCRAYCPWPTEFFIGHLMRESKDGRQVIISFGTCKNCKPSFEE